MQLKGFAQSQSATPAVDNKYVGKAVKHDNAEIDFNLKNGGDSLIEAAYATPFFIAFVVLVVIFITVWFCSSLEDLATSIKGSPTFQANTVSAVLICAILVLYTTALDVTSCVRDYDDSLPSYYTRRMEFLGLTITFLFFYFICFLLGILLLVLEAVFLLRLWFKKADNPTEHMKSGGTVLPNQEPDTIHGPATVACTQPGEREGEAESPTIEEGTPPDGEESMQSGGAGPLDTKAAVQSEKGSSNYGEAHREEDTQCGVAAMKLKKLWKIDSGHHERIALFCVLIVGSAFLSLTAHFPSILMAWATDPFYASKIALFYGISIVCYFTVFHYSYVLSIRAFSKGVNKKRSMIIIPIIITVIIIAVTTVIGLITVFVITVPVSNSIETAADGITSIYNGAIVLIGGLLAYRIGWHYIGHSFSVSDAVQGAIHDMKPPFGIDEEVWKNKTDEGRLTELVKAIVEIERFYKAKDESAQNAPTIVQVAAPQ